MRILCLQHDPLDGPGSLMEWARDREHSLSSCLISHGERLPAIDSFDLLVSLGGAMGAYEEDLYPWLAAEKKYLRQAVASGKLVLGLCLGCQLLADALGGRAFRHTCKEFGWQPIMPTDAGKEWFPLSHKETNLRALKSHEKGTFLAFQWHGDTFTLPPGALHLARNEAAEQQAFLMKGPMGSRALGLQFHLEWTEQMAREALAEPGVAPPPSNSVQTPEEILSDLSVFEAAKDRFFVMLDRFTQ